MEYLKIYPLDASYDHPEDVPQEIKENKRYAGAEGYTISEVANAVEKDFGKIDFLVHSLANGPEVKKPLLETSRAGYLAAISTSSYSFVSLLAHFGPLLNKGGASVSLTYLAKAALESDTRTLAWEAGRKWGIRVNVISAGALRSRAARAIGFIDNMIEYGKANAPLPKDLEAQEIGHSAAFLLSPLASAITGVTLYVDNGMHAMGLAIDSPAFQEKP
jgi:enoyl-[acyl-carrier protein] reductase I